MKKLLSILALALVQASISAQSETITVYTYRHYQSDDTLFQKFAAQTGIKVQVVKSKAGALLERLIAEGERTSADILITADAAGLHLAQESGVLQPIQSDFLESRIPSHLREPQGYWFGFTTRARVIAYNPDFVSPQGLSTYEALAEPQWRGRIISRSSSNIYNQSLLASIIEKSDKKTAIEWARKVRKNMARPPQGNDRDQMRAVAAGLADAAIVNTYYLGLLANSENAADRKVADKLKLFFPNQDGRGTHVNISGGGVVANADNVSGAKKFLEFLASDEAQSIFPTESAEYPAVPSIEWSPMQKSWGEFKADDTALSRVGQLNAEAIRCFNLAGWE